MKIENRKAQIASLQLRHLLEDEGGHVDERKVTESLLRVFLTKESFGSEESVESNENEENYIYAQMQYACINMRKYGGDAESFYQIYTALKDLQKEDIIDFLNISSHRRQVVIPETIEATIESYIGENAKSILITDAFVYEGAFMSLIGKNADKEIVITAHDPDMVKLMSIAYSGHENVKVSGESIYRDDNVGKMFDFIFSVPKFMPVRPERRRREDFNNETPREVKELDTLLSSLTENGVLVTCVPNSFAMAGGIIQRERERIQDQYKVIELSSLPGGMAPGTGIKTTFCAIARGKTGDVLFRKYDFVDDPENRFGKPGFENDMEVKDEITLSADEFHALQSWNIDRAFSSKDEEISAYKYSEVKKTVLKEVASTFRGKSLPPKGEGPHGPRPDDRPPVDGSGPEGRPHFEEECRGPRDQHGPKPPMGGPRPEGRSPFEGECGRPPFCSDGRPAFGEKPSEADIIEAKVINLSDMTESGIDYSNLDIAHGDANRLAKHLLKKGDVLMSARGTQIKIAVFGQDEGNYIASSNINIIRCDQDILRGEYLALFLKSKVGMKIISSLTRGATLININYTDLLDIEVPLPSLEKQDEVVARYNNGLAEYQKKVSEAQKEWNEIVETVYSNLY